MPVTRMVALGSSFAAGPGIEPLADAAAGRSERNFPHLVAEALGAALIDATVSGATSETILRVPQRRGRRRFMPQIESIDPRRGVDLVTITSGGNDLGYLAAVLRAATANRLAARRVAAPLARLLREDRAPVRDEQVEQATRGLTAVVEAVRQRAPHARILLVDYLTIVGPETRPSAAVPFTVPQLDRIRTTAERLAGVFREAARRSGAELVTVSDVSESHALDAADPWVNGLRLRFPFRELGSSFHPNAAGMAAVSQAVLLHLAAPEGRAEG